MYINENQAEILINALMRAYESMDVEIYNQNYQIKRLKGRIEDLEKEAKNNG